MSFSLKILQSLCYAERESKYQDVSDLTLSTMHDATVISRWVEHVTCIT